MKSLKLSMSNVFTSLALFLLLWEKSDDQDLIACKKLFIIIINEHVEYEYNGLNN